MSRPGGFALRVLGVTAVLFALMAPASFGQAASLSGEFLDSVSPLPGQQTTFEPFVCDKDGNTPITFHTQGAASGPYNGTFTETGTFTIGPQTDPSLGFAGPILNFEASFAITSDSPTGTVEGSKALVSPPPEASLSALGSCDPDGSTEANSNLFVVVSDPLVLYDAQIDAETGSRSDSGTSGFTIQGLTNPVAPTTLFQEAFNSTAPDPPDCDDDDDDDDHHGHWGDHWKKWHHHGDDDDDDEDCDDH